MSRDYHLYLEDIQDCCAKIRRYTSGMSIELFVSDEKTYDAVIRNVEVIGEAVKQVPADIRAQYPQVKWRKIAGMRDIVAHAYFGINDEILWDVIQNSIPELEQDIISILRDYDRFSSS